MNVLRFLLRRSWKKVALAAAAGIASGLAGAGVIAIIHRALASAPGVDFSLLTAFVGTALFAVLCKGVSEILLTQLGQSAVAEMRLQISRQVVESPLRQIEEQQAHRILATLTDDATTISQAYVYLPLIAVNAATVVGCVAYLGWISPWVLGLTAIAMVAGVFIFEVISRNAVVHFESARETNDALYRHFRGLTDGIKELKLSRPRTETFLAHVLGRSVASYRQSYGAGMAVYSLAMGWGSLLFYGTVGATIFGLPAAANLNADAVSGAALALLYLMGPLGHLLEILPAVGRAGVALRKIETLGLALDRELEKTAIGAALPLGQASHLAEQQPFRFWQSIAFDGVTHRYYSEADQASFQLGPVNFTMRPGELIYVIGGNGSGKTTLALLLLGLYTPNAGAIRLDGVEVDESTREAYRQLYSAVFADYYLFEDLLEVEPAALARAQHYLERLQLDRRLRFDGQRLPLAGLSRGQRKRVALLFAALEDRPLYLFDEWACDQDPLFRRVFYTELLPELRARGKTAIVITHDDHYFDRADRCFRMDFGRLREIAG